MKNKIDLRIIKTNKVLFEALITLMEQKDFEKIKISDICDQALINRSTFYAHYEDKYDLLLAMINDLKNNLERELKENKEEDISKNYFMEFLKILINHVDEKRETYNSILKNDKNGIVMGFLIDVSYRDLTRIANINESLWSQLFLGNKKNLLKSMKAFENEFNKILKCIEDEDKEGLEELFIKSSKRREKL